ncbi:MAG: electron transport complex subunit RsxC [Tenuifilaceae bacterium]
MKTFKLGGVHPKENKLSSNQKIKEIGLPKTAIISLTQCLGVSPDPVVNKGDKVKVGQLVAKGNAFISANIHSSVSGTVSKIEDAIDASGFRKKSITVDVEGDEWMESIDRNQTINYDINISKDEVISKIKEAGIVGMGGATFPTHVKLMIPAGKKAEYLIINGVECEPYLTSDHRIMIEKGDELMIGIRLLMKALNVQQAFIGIEKNKPDAIEHLTNLAEKSIGVKVVPLKVKYPQGGEKQLIKAVVNREVPSGKLPIEVGCVVQNVGTAYAVYEAVQKNKPLIDRVVTVTGKSVKKPSNFLARIGTPISMLLEEAGGIPDDTRKVINGGPMMGKSLNSLDVSVVKGMSGLVIMPESESKRPSTANCIRCAKCTFACPMGLAPYQISLFVESGFVERAEEERVMDCMECGSCAYTCPSARPLLDNLRVAKNKVGLIIRSRAK